MNNTGFKYNFNDNSIILKKNTYIYLIKMILQLFKIFYDLTIFDLTLIVLTINTLFSLK